MWDSSGRLGADLASCRDTQPSVGEDRSEVTCEYRAGPAAPFSLPLLSARAGGP